MNSALIMPTNQTSSTTNTPLQQIPDSYSSDILKRIQSSPYLRIIPEKKCCPPPQCQKITFSIYTLSAIDDDFKSNENEVYLFKAVLTPLCCTPFQLPCEDFEIKCYAGSNYSLANDYFCSYRIKGRKCCPCPPDFSECCNCKCNCICNCNNEIFIPMTFDIAPSKLEINQDNNEAPFGTIERYRTCCTKLNVRKFYDYGQGDFKYQIGSENCVCECSCGCECSCTGCCECYKIQRFKFKTIKNQEGAECGEFDSVLEPTCFGLCYNVSWEIKFPNDATVSMKLLLLGGLIEAILLPYVSVPYPRRIKNY